MSKIYHLKAIVATPVGQLTGNLNSAPIPSYEEAVSLRDRTQVSLRSKDWIVLHTPEPTASDGKAESFLSKELLANSAVLFIITEEYKLVE